MEPQLCVMMKNIPEKIAKTLHHYERLAAIYIRRQWWSLFPIEVNRPVFIVGCSRAGTTLVYKTFSMAKELGTLRKESHAFWAALHPIEERDWESHVLGREYACEDDRRAVSRYFYSYTGSTRFVDKNNQNGLCIPYLHALFPEAAFVYVKRSPGDNINSLIEGWGKPDEYGAWAGDLPEKIEIDGGHYTRWCFFLPKHWRDYVSASIEDVCALQYVEINQAILEGKKLVPESQWVEIKYEDLLDDPVRGFQQAFESLGLSFSTDIQHHCETVLQRPYNAFSEIKRDKWRIGKNAQRIEVILPKVESIAVQMGYKP